MLTSKSGQNVPCPEKFVVDVLPRLVQAKEYAEATRQSIWQFALELEILIEAQLSRNDLRLLLSLGVLEKRNEITSDGDRVRRFSDAGDAAIAASACFVLGENGLQLMECQTSQEQTLDAQQTRTASVPTNLLPRWYQDARELHYAGNVVKRFRARAANQEKILDAFEEENWPSRIDDPLPSLPGQLPSQRLRDTIKCLNRRHECEAIRFHCDGTGQGICWRRRTGPTT